MLRVLSFLNAYFRYPLDSVEEEEVGGVVPGGLRARHAGEVDEVAVGELPPLEARAERVEVARRAREAAPERLEVRGGEEPGGTEGHADG